MDDFSREKLAIWLCNILVGRGIAKVRGGGGEFFSERYSRNRAHITENYII